MEVEYSLFVEENSLALGHVPLACSLDWMEGIDHVAAPHGALDAVGIRS